MERTRKTLKVTVRNNKTAQKFQADVKHWGDWESTRLPNSGQKALH